MASTTNSSASPVYTSSGACSNVGTLYTMTSGTGTCTSTATWAADANYNGATLNQTTTASKIDPTTTFTGARQCGVPAHFTVASTTNSSASPVYTASGACSNVGTLYTMTSGTGTCTSTVTWAADANYNGATLSQTTAAVRATASVLLSNLTQSYDGTPKSATVTTVPSGLAVIVTYDGSPTAPTAVGSYSVVATVSDANYQGSATGTLLIQDTTAPDTTITSGPTSPTNSTDASFTFSGTDNVTPAASLTFQCSLDGAAAAPCTSPAHLQWSLRGQPHLHGGGHRRGGQHRRFCRRPSPGRSI